MFGSTLPVKSGNVGTLRQNLQHNQDVYTEFTKIRMSEGYILYYYTVCVVFVCVLVPGECFSNSCSFHRKDTAFSSGLEFVMGFVLEL